MNKMVAKFAQRFFFRSPPAPFKKIFGQTKKLYIFVGTFLCEKLMIAILLFTGELEEKSPRPPFSKGETQKRNPPSPLFLRGRHRREIPVSRPEISLQANL